jgi:thiol-disulfide isomerase/thioredoxin
MKLISRSSRKRNRASSGYIYRENLNEMISRLHVLFIIASIALVAFFAFGCSSDQPKTESPTPVARVKPEPMAAPVETPVLPVVTFAAYDVYGTLRQSSEWIGKQPVVINFWGTWCPPCRVEIPDLKKVYAEYRSQGVEMISLAVGKDTPQDVIDYVRRAGMEWVQLMGTREIAEAFELTGSVPTTIFLNAEGQEVERFVGMKRYEDFKKAFEKTL